MGYRWLVSTLGPDDAGSSSQSTTYTAQNTAQLVRILWGVRRRGEELLYIEWRAR